MDIKDRLTAEVQRRTDRTVYIQALNNHLDCIAVKEEKKNPIVFIYKDNKNRYWNFKREDFLSWLSSKLICIFVCKDENEFEEYHIISFVELLEKDNIDFKDFLNNKEKEYSFEDFNNKYKDNWKIFE